MMHKLIYVCLFIGCLTNIKAQSSSWEIISPPQPEPETAWDKRPWQDIFFVDDNNGWVVGFTDTILYTPDGGASWQVQKSPIPFTAQKGGLRKVQFADAQHGWALGTDTLGKDFLIKTSDGGNTWATITNLPNWTNYLNPVPILWHYEDLKYFSSGDAWLAGTYITGYFPNEKEHFFICKTENHFASWGIDTFQNKKLNQIYFFGKDDVLLRTDNYRYAKTTNGGINWQQDTLAGFTRLSAMYCAQPIVNHLIAYSQNVLCLLQRGGYVYTSVNGGNSWTLRPPLDTAIYDIEMYESETNGKTSGVLFNGSVFKVISSKDFGVTWSLGLPLESPKVKLENQGFTCYCNGQPNIYKGFVFEKKPAFPFKFFQAFGDTIIGLLAQDDNYALVRNTYILRTNLSGKIFPSENDISIPDPLSYPKYLNSVPNGLASCIQKMPDVLYALRELTGRIVKTPNQTLWILDAYRSIYKSVDGGMSLQYVVARGQKSNLLKIKFRDTQTGITVGTYGMILRSEDSGMTWNPIISPTNSTLFDLTWVNTNEVQIVGTNGTFLRSTDAGLSFQQVFLDTFPHHHFYSIASRNDTIRIGADNAAFFSVNGGDSFVIDTMPFVDSLLQTAEYTFTNFIDVDFAIVDYIFKQSEIATMGSAFMYMKSKPYKSLISMYNPHVGAGTYYFSTKNLSSYYSNNHLISSIYGFQNKGDITEKQYGALCGGLPQMSKICGKPYLNPILDNLGTTGFVDYFTIHATLRTRDFFQTSVIEQDPWAIPPARIFHFYMFDSCHAWGVGENNFIYRYNPPAPSCLSSLISPSSNATEVSVLPLLKWKCANNLFTVSGSSGQDSVVAQKGFIDGYILSLGTAPGSNDLGHYDIHVDTFLQVTDTLPAGIKVFTTIQPYNCKGVAQGCQSDWFVTQCPAAAFAPALTQLICQGESFTFFGKPYTQSGIYYDTLQTLLGCDSLISSLNLFVFSSASATLSGGGVFCNTAETQLQVDFTGSGPFTFSYSIDGVSQAPITTTDDPYFIPVNTTVSTTYALAQLTTSGCSGMVTGQAVITIPFTSKAYIAPPAYALSCTHPTLTLDGSASILGPCSVFEWTAVNGGNIVSGAQGASPVVNNGGTYRLIITDPCGGCPDTAWVTVLTGSFAAPNASALGDILDCGHPTVSIMANSTTPGALYSWNISGLGIVNQQNVTVGNPGDYQLTVTAPNGCTATAVATVLQDISLPQAVAVGASITCADLNPYLNGSSTTPDASFAWSGPTGFTATDPNPQVFQAGDYVLLVTGPNGCTATATATVNIDISLPVINAPAAQKICLGQTATITATGSDWLAVEWRTPQGVLVDSGAVLTVTPVAAGLNTYSIVATALNGCTATATATLETGPPLQAHIMGQDSVCIGEYTLLTAGGGDNYVWGNGNTDSTLTFYPSQGQNTVTVTVSNSFGCTQAVTYSVLGKPVVNVAIHDDNALCFGMKDTLHIAPGTNGNTFQWSPGGSTLNYLIINPQTTTIYKVSAEKTGFCSGIDSVTVEVRLPPEAIASATLEVIACADTISLHGNTPPAPGNGQWLSLGSADIPQIDQAFTIAENLISGDNRFVWIVSNVPCPGPARDTVTVFYTKEVPVLYPDDTLTIEAKPIQLHLLLNDSIDHLPGYTISLRETDLNGVWSLTPNGTLTFEPSLDFTGSADAVYEICNALCPDICDETSIHIFVRQPKGDIGQTLAITPNGDDKNETLIFDYLDQYMDNSIIIFNRWGQQVFYRKPYENDWNGMYNNKPLPAGTYYYILNLQGEDNQIWGNVLIVR